MKKAKLKDVTAQDFQYSRKNGKISLTVLEFTCSPFPEAYFCLICFKCILSGTLDFIGVNHYTSNYVFPNNGGSPGLDGDQNCGSEIDPAWEETAAPWLKVFKMNMT